MGSSSFGPVVTVSATYGSGGSVIAPRLAEDLGVPFIDRLISRRPVAGGWPSEAALGGGSGRGGGDGKPDRAASFSYFARAASVGAMILPDPILDDDESIRARLAAELQKVAQGRRPWCSGGPVRWCCRPGPGPSTSASTGRSTEGEVGGLEHDGRRSPGRGPPAGGDRPGSHRLRQAALPDRPGRARRCTTWSSTRPSSGSIGPSRSSLGRRPHSSRPIPEPGQRARPAAR